MDNPQTNKENNQQAEAIDSSPEINSDERVRKVGIFRSMMSRPEFGALAGAVFIFFIFYVAAGRSGMFSAEGIINWTTVAAYLGILATGAALLMIAGEFDLSVGSMAAFAGMLLAIPVLYWSWPVWLSLIFALVVCVSIGGVNGWLVIRTGLPSFIVTLAFLFILRGLALSVSIIFTGKTILSSNEGLLLYEVLEADPIFSFLFYGHVFKGFFNWLAANGIIGATDTGRPFAIGVPKVIIWWLIIAAIGAFVLAKTKYGNWILATGGDVNAAKNVGIPVNRLKIVLFALTALCATIFAFLQVADAGSAAADRALLKEFEAIIAAVIGGCLLTGGFGSVIGAAFGAVIFGMVQIGIGYTTIDNNWYRVFLGLMLLLAVIFNNFIRNRFALGKR